MLEISLLLGESSHRDGCAGRVITRRSVATTYYSRGWHYSLTPADGKTSLTLRYGGRLHICGDKRRFSGKFLSRTFPEHI